MPSSYHVVENPGARAWDQLVRSRNGHVLQTAGWGELKAGFGWSALRVGLERNGALCAGALVLIRTLPLGMRLAYVPRGPVVDASDSEALSALTDALAAAARARGAFALKLEPDWCSASPRPVPAPLHVVGSGKLQTGRAAECIQPHTSIHVDLTRDLDTILAQMKPKWRYNIRLAERKGVSVREGTAADLPEFHRLLQITGARDRFGIHAPAYYRAVFERLGDSARLFIAEYQGQALAAVFVTAFGAEAIYLYGASSDLHRERMPNHALHWRVIQWARACGCTRYDLWGIPDDGEEPADHAVADGAPPPAASGAVRPSETASRLPQGLYQFKQGFGGHVVRYAPATDLVFSRPLYAIYRRALAWRRAGAG